MRPAEGAIRLGVTEGGAVRVETASLDDYVAGVVSAEAPPDAPAPVREALAVAARSYARANLGRHHAEGFDVCDLTHCQAYRAGDPRSTEAARATAGLVLTRDGVVIAGVSQRLVRRPTRGAERALAAASASLDAAMPARPDPVAHDPDAWRSDVSASDLLRALRAAGLARGRTARPRGTRTLAFGARGRRCVSTG